MVYTIRHNVPVITGRDLQKAREALGLTQEQFGELIHEAGKTVGNWERADHIPPRKRAEVSHALIDAGAIEPEPESLTDVALIAALTARLAWYGSRVAELEAQLSQPADESSREASEPGRLRDKNLAAPRAAWTERPPRQRRRSVPDSQDARAVGPDQGNGGEVG